MKLAHLILTHANPQQSERLIKRLSHPDAHWFIHVDAKTDIKPFLYLKNIPNVQFVEKREKVTWGAYSIIQATINGLTAIVNHNINFNYVNLLSAQDYPLVSTETIHQFLEKNLDRAFTEFYLVATEWQEAIFRLKKYHLTNHQFKGNQWVEKWMNKLLPERKMPQNLIPVGRSQWFTIAGKHAKYIVDYLNKHKDVQRFFDLTWGSDEIVIQTILYNSPFRQDMVNDNLRYIDWSEGKPSPKTFTLNDANTLLSCGKLFARKFNDTVDVAILNKLDEAAGLSPIKV
ncbi:MAG: beta-1,6-N-acetylglucosaminyltransferase [Chitinophagaceae bacterium]